MSPETHRQDFHQLYEFEYGDLRELLFRMTAISAATALFTLATGWEVGIWWLAVYFPLHLLNFSYFCLRWDAPTLTDIKVSSFFFTLLVANFIWLPGFLLLQQGNLALQVTGAATISCLLIWLIIRSDKQNHLVVSEVLVMGLGAAALIFKIWPMLPSVLERLGVSIAVTGVVVYFTIAIYKARDQRIKAQLAATRSAEAQKMEALGHLASGVAHDFNNILTATIGNLELYYEVTSATEKEQCIEEAVLAARSGEALVRKLLQFGRRRPEQCGSMVLREMIDNLRALSRRLVPAQVKVSITASRCDLTLPVKQEDLTTALLNLMVNARDAMPKGGNLTVSANIEDLQHARMMLDGLALPAGTYVNIIVADTGSGIPHDVLNRVLEPFFTTKPEGHGSGLGLPMAASFAREAGGGLTIMTSKEGTRVSMYLPLQNIPESPASADAA